MRLLHLSDLHFGTEQPAVAQALVEFAQALQPTATIVSGDLTQRATDDQFDACAAFLARLPKAPMLVIPGNHDVPLYQLLARFASPFGRYRRFLSTLARHSGAEPPGQGSGNDADWLDPVLALPGLTVLGVNTTRSWRQQDGAISSAQIAAVEQRLRAAPATDWRLVVTHHPLAVLRAEDQGDRPLRHAEARRRWAAAGAQLMLSGHVHVPAVLPVDGARMRETTGKAVAGGTSAAADDAAAALASSLTPDTVPAWAVSSGSGVSARLVPGFPNSVNVLVQADGEGDGTPPQRRVERHDFNPRSARFEPAAVNRLMQG